MKKWLLIALFGLSALPLAACERKEGPVEETGEEIDQGLDKTGEQIDKAGEEAKEKAD